MKLEKCLEYYSEQGSITSPGKWSDLVEIMGKDTIKLCEYIHQIVLIDFIPNMGLATVPQEHLKDVFIRGIEEKLEKLMERDNSSIISPRSYETITLGNCRDLSLMMCSVLRQNNIPARLRSGFGTFFHPGKYFDHWVCEYFDHTQRRWIRVDPWMSQIHYRKDILPPPFSEGLLKLDLNPYDVQNEYFITGGEAWLNCRENGHDPDNYGTYEPDLKGYWFIRDNMIRDLLCLNKIEPLAWDCWGPMGRDKNDFSNEEFQLLDEIAKFLVKSDFTKNELLEMLERLKIKEEVINL